MPDSAQGLDADFERVDCLICGPASAEELSHVGMHGHPAHVVICRGCGLLYLDPRWTKRRYERFYADEYDQYYRSALGATAPTQSLLDSRVSAFERATAEAAFDRLRAADLMPSLVRKVLDIGSGSGGFLLEARRLFPDAGCAAIEPSPNCVPLLLNAGIEHVASDVDSDWDLGREGAFDFVYMRHVLEHFVDPLRVLRRVRAALADDGLLYIAVPNSLNPQLPITTSFFRVVHTYYFNRATLPILLGRAGLTPVMLIDGDVFNWHELVIAARRGDVVRSAVNSSYASQRDLLLRHIGYEATAKYQSERALRMVKRKIGRMVRRG